VAVHLWIRQVCNDDTELSRSGILTAWNELNQRVIDTAGRQWRTRLSARVTAKAGHSEHKLSPR